MDRINDSKINQYLQEFSKEAGELDRELREAVTIEREKPIKYNLAVVQSIIKQLYNMRTAQRKEKEKEV